MGPKRRKTGSAALASVKQSDQEKSIAAALCERLVRCQDENGHDLSRDDFQVDVDANIPANIRLGAHQAAIILQVCDLSLQNVHFFIYSRDFTPRISTIKINKISKTRFPFVSGSDYGASNSNRHCRHSRQQQSCSCCLNSRPSKGAGSIRTQVELHNKCPSRICPWADTVASFQTSCPSRYPTPKLCSSPIPA